MVPNQQKITPKMVKIVCEPFNSPIQPNPYNDDILHRLIKSSYDHDEKWNDSLFIGDK